MGQPLRAWFLSKDELRPAGLSGQVVQSIQAPIEQDPPLPASVQSGWDYSIDAGKGVSTQWHARLGQFFLSAMFVGQGAVYAPAISSCHNSFGDRPVFCHPLVKQFLQGVRRQRPMAPVPSPR